MGKKKQKPSAWGARKPRKDTSVFKVAGSKVSKLKHKAKPVASTFKKLDNKARIDANTAKADENFSKVHKSLLKQEKQKVPTISGQKKKKDLTGIVDVNKTTEDFAKL